MNAVDIVALIDIAKKAGLRRIKTPEIELEFGPPEEKPMDLEAMKKVAEALGQDALTDEQALFYSSPMFVEATALHEAQTKMGIPQQEKE
jgi:hypothetical protein